ncbi:MAG: RNA polymerase sigma factor [Firmicutes bacterium]|jgi:RNA polymerase sigma-70 factor (ECF subfamily)|nr:RNA polymerase sigma factor [Bacillota bacterium]
MEDFESIVKTHQKRVYNTCLRLCGNPDDAFDLSQETFLKAWRGLENFRGESELSTWLFRLTVNVCNDFLRKKARRGIVVSLDDTELPLPDARYEPSAALERRELSRTLKEALEKLSPEHRQVITLRETAELSYGEIAALLGIEEGTVKSRLARARMALREMLIKGGNDLPNRTSNRIQRTERGGKNGSL